MFLVNNSHCFSAYPPGITRVLSLLDNNICERILKKAILHRKNALFYKTNRGAHVGDILMSLIHTAELCEADAFGYLTELERHAKDVAVNPQDWMPWSYCQTLAAATPAIAP